MFCVLSLFVCFFVFFSLSSKENHGCVISVSVVSHLFFFFFFSRQSSSSSVQPAHFPGLVFHGREGHSGTGMVMEAEMQELRYLVAQLRADNERLRQEQVAAVPGPSTVPQDRKCPIFREGQV